MKYRTYREDHDQLLPRSINTITVTVQNGSVYGHFTQFMAVVIRPGLLNILFVHEIESLDFPRTNTPPAHVPVPPFQ